MTDSVVGRIERAAAGEGIGGPGGTVTFVEGDDFATMTWSALYEEARLIAGGLQQRGIRTGDHIAVVGLTPRALVVAIEATWLVGAVAIVVPLPSRDTSVEALSGQVRSFVSLGHCVMVLLDQPFHELLGPLDLGAPHFAIADVAAVAHYEPPADDPDKLVILQFTSGSTADPKGVMLTDRNLAHNLAAASQALQLDANDVFVSWLPLFHDMGLIGLLALPMTTGLSLVLGRPQDFVADPLRWMRWISEFHGTRTAAPNFAYTIATRALRRVAGGLDLSTLRTAINGSEPVVAATFREFGKEGSRFGLRNTTLFPAFGMAELCIAGIFPEPDIEMETDVVDAQSIDSEGIAAEVSADTMRERELVVLGSPVPGLSARIVNPDTETQCEDRAIGELQIRGASVTSGYFANPDSTREAFVDGWLRTGDLAYTVRGKIVICGRIKDMIIIAGRNIYPQDVEQLVEQVSGVRPGSVAAAGMMRGHDECLVIVAEAADEVEPAVLREAIRATVIDGIGISPAEIVVLARGEMPKTTSGKLQRWRCKQLVHERRPDLAVGAAPSR